MRRVLKYSAGLVVAFIAFSWVVYGSPLAAFSGGPEQRRVVEKWLQELQRGNPGLEQWGPNLNSYSSLYNVKSWKLIATDNQGSDCYLRYRIQSTNKGGIPVDVIWEIKSTKNDEDGKWYISDMYEP